MSADAAPPRGERSLVHLLLIEQQELTAVERFAQRHERHEANDPPLQAKYYRDRIPLTTPKPGEQYAFEVDLDACTGCKACVTACHSLNGLDQNETWRGVGLLHTVGASEPFQQTVTAACHHCADPACLNGCPVNAYEKDPVTGIVKHLDDQCIGCQYCVLKCPYDVPKFNSDRGIVRKCDMCSDRLTGGEAPACVQACPNGAIRIGVVSIAENAARATRAEFLTAAPEPAYTQPTTRYTTKRAIPKGVVAGDHFAVVPEHGHPPLVVMLVTTQMAVGALTLAALMQHVPAVPIAGALHPYLTLGAALFAVIGIHVALLHLGRPLYAFRAVLNVRRSWLSREAVAFGAFAPAACAYAATAWVARIGVTLPAWAPPALGAAAALAGAASVFCSVMVYVDTRRSQWALGPTTLKFFLTAAVLGLGAGLLATHLAGSLADAATLALALTLATTAKLAHEVGLLDGVGSGDRGRAQTAALLAGPLAGTARLRVACGALGGLLLPAFATLVALASPLAGTVAVGVALAALYAGELLERHLFFVAAAAPRMPGAVRS